ncbi:MAG: tetratricopeptide repeat protein [Promethearchaeota archaeon]|nr:MAG: tetratricopeptide repeat protein [Candidatus Lokiarchaeota archaeon]
MKSKNLTFKELIEGKKLTFLVGAGCSVDAPSCLPAGRMMMDAIIRHTCAESEIEKLLAIKELRFEQLVEIVRDELDSELKIIDYYGLCDTPNLQHFFLAQMLKKGHFVMTTNFDFLIEYSLQQSDVPEDEIVPVITRNDFEKYDNPEELFNEGKKAVYKIHGSSKNVISGESTKHSLVATIQAFGSGKEGESVFQVELFKRPLFENISRGRTLVVMGYSGSDDFDIVPTLRVLKGVESIVWVDYTSDDGGKEQIYEITSELDQNTEGSNKMERILGDLYHMGNAKHVYRVDANTSRLAKDMLKREPPLSEEKFPVSPGIFLEDNITPADGFRRFCIPYKIYHGFDRHPDSMRCLTTILKLAEKQENLGWKSFALGEIGMIYYAQGNYPEALKRCEEALQIDEQLGDLSGKATRLNNIGLIYDAQGNYPEALKCYEGALQISEQLGDLSGKATRLNNIGLIYNTQGNYSEALKRYEEALQIDEQLGNLLGKATRLNNIGLIYDAQGNYPEALKRYEEALKVDEQLGNLSGKATRLNNIGSIHYAQGNYSEALKRYEEALQVDEQLGNLSGKTTCLNNIGSIHYAQGNYKAALQNLEQALQIFIALGLETSPNAQTIGKSIETVKSKLKR